MSLQQQSMERAGIARLIPHGGSMCLLHSLDEWSAEHIRCSAISHRDADNPLRCGGALLAPVAIEYASQAMALHGTLNAAPDATPMPGFLASVRGVRLLVPRLDQLAGALHITARRLAGDSAQAMYAFSLHDEAGSLLVEGRATVILSARLLEPSG